MKTFDKNYFNVIGTSAAGIRMQLVSDDGTATKPVKTHNLHETRKTHREVHRRNSNYVEMLKNKYTFTEIGNDWVVQDNEQ